VPDADDESGLVAVRVDRQPQRTVVTLVGELDMSNAEDVFQQLSSAAAAGHEPLEVDLSKLGFIDSAGIATIDRLHRRLAESGRLRVQAPADTVAGRTLRLAGMDQVLPMKAADPAD
jgi:anti-sigma B factor antagonist